MGTSTRATQLNLSRRLRRLRRTPRSGRWCGPALTDQFILPLFVTEGSGVRREVSSMPGVFQLSVDEAVTDARRGARWRAGGAASAAGMKGSGPTIRPVCRKRSARFGEGAANSRHRRVPKSAHLTRPLRAHRRRRHRQRRQRRQPGSRGGATRCGRRPASCAVGHDGRPRRRDPLGARRRGFDQSRSCRTRRKCSGPARSAKRPTRAAVWRSAQPPDGSANAGGGAPWVGRTSRRRGYRDGEARRPVSTSSGVKERFGYLTAAYCERQADDQGGGASAGSTRNGRCWSADRDSPRRRRHDHAYFARDAARLLATRFRTRDCRPAIICETRTSSKLYARASTVPGGVNSPVRRLRVGGAALHRQAWRAPHRRRRQHLHRLRDVVGPMIHGHAPAGLASDRAAGEDRDELRCLARSKSSSPPSPRPVLSMERMLCEFRTEATMSVARVAAATARARSLLRGAITVMPTRFSSRRDRAR